MKSLTIHKLDDQLAEHLKNRAEAESISMNELVKRTLAESFGLKVPTSSPHREDFAAFCGAWSPEDAKVFDARAAETRRIDPEDWT